MRLKLKNFLLVIAANLVCTGIIFWYIKEVYKATVISALEQSTKGIPHLLGKEYFDRIINKQSVSDQEYNNILEKFEKYVQDIGGITFIYAYTLDGNRIVEVADTPTPAEKIERSPFFSEYHSASPNIKEMLRNAEAVPQVEYYSDEYGDFISYLMPYKNAKGRIFVIGSDYEIRRFHKELWIILGFSLVASSFTIAGYVWVAHRYRYFTKKGRFLRLLPFLFIFTILFWQSDRYRSAALEKRLYTAGRTVVDILGQDYLDRALNRNSISSQEYAINRSRLHQYTRSIELLYTYVLRKEGETVYFIAVDDPPDEKGSYEGYWAVYNTVSSSVLPLFTKVGRTDMRYTDEYGKVYSVFFSIPDRYNNLVVIGADQAQSLITQTQQQQLWQSFVVALLNWFVIVIAWEYVRRQIRNKSEEIETLSSDENTKIPEKLSWKIASVTISVIVITLAIFYWFTERVLYESYAQIEKQTIINQLNELSNSFEFEVTRHSNYLNNWLADGDTYKFANDRERWFQEMGFMPEALARLDINLLMYLDKQNRIVTQISSKPGLSKILLSYLQENGDLLLFPHQTRQARTELITLEGRLYILTVAPIFRLDVRQGVLATVKVVDSAFVESLAKRQKLNVRFYAIEDVYKIARFQPILQNIKQTGNGQVVPENDTYIYGYTLIRNSQDQPIVFASLISKRDVFIKGRRLIDGILLYGLSGFGLVVIVTNLILLRELILKRLSQLVHNIQHLQHVNNLGNRLIVDGNDEIAYLIRTFNQLLEKIATERNNLDIERNKAERLLRNILPESIAEQLKQRLSIFTEGNDEVPIAEQYENVAVLFADIVGFTTIAKSITPQEVVKLLNSVFSSFDKLTERYKLEKIKTIGDAYMVVGGLPEPMSNPVIAVAAMALDMQQAITEFRTYNGEHLSIRVGIHVGVVIAGTIGKKKFAYDLWGDTVNIASRMESQGEPDKIQVSEDIYQCLKEKYSFEERGQIPIKGIGNMKTYWLSKLAN